MAKAFILIETMVGKNRDVNAALKTIPGIKSVDTVTGPYDIVAVLEADSLNSIGEMITGKIQLISGITRTVTCLAL